MARPIVNPFWPEFVEREADLERAERAASRELRPAEARIAARIIDDLEWQENYDRYMAGRLGKTVEELRAGRAEFKAEVAAKKAAKEFEAAIEIDFETPEMKEDEDEMATNATIEGGAIQVMPKGVMIEASNATAIDVYSRMPDTTLAVQFLGNSIAKSGMFGCSSVEQGHVMALECLTTGVPPLTMAKRYHVINNQLSMRADFMLAEFHRRGGKSSWISRTHELAAIKLQKPGDDWNEFALSWEDAQKEPFPYKGNEGAIIEMLAKGQKPALKAKYATPRSRMQMLSARVVSDAIRAIMPEVNEGRYTPEEFDAEDWEANGAAAGTAATVATVTTVEPATVAASVVEPVQDAEIIDKLVEPESTKRVTHADARKLSDLAANLISRGELTYQQLCRACEKRGALMVHELSPEKADEIYKILEKKAETLPASDATTSEPVDSVIGEAEVLELRTLIGELNQREPKTAAAVKSWLQSKGLETLKQLRRSQYRELRAKTAIENLEAFIAASLAEVKQEIASGN